MSVRLRARGAIRSHREVLLTLPHGRIRVPASHRTGAGLALGPSAAYRLLRNYRRWRVEGVLVFRLLAGVPSVWIVAGYSGVSRVLPVILVAVAVGLANVALFVAVWRGPEPAERAVKAVLLVDTVVAVALNLWSTVAVPGSILSPYRDVFWFYCLGTAMLWTAWYGPARGLLVVVGSAPLLLLMAEVDGSPVPHDWVPTVAGRLIWMAVGTVTAILILMVLRLSADVALAEGERAGRQAEQLRVLRAVHDTTLQTLEAIRLTARTGELDPHERLDTIAAAARAQAAELRTSLSSRADREDPVAVGPALTDALAETGARLAAHGIRLDRHDRRTDGVTLAASRCEALGWAAREALTNVVRHSSAARAVVTTRTTADSVEVTVRDDGRGFDPGTTRGFGIEQSILARLAEAGGGAAIESRPHRGTLVRMWVPRDV